MRLSHPATGLVIERNILPETEGRVTEADVEQSVRIAAMFLAAGRHVEFDKRPTIEDSIVEVFNPGADTDHDEPIGNFGGLVFDPSGGLFA